MGSEPAKVQGHPSRFVPIFRLIFVVEFLVVGFFVFGYQHLLGAVRAGKLRSLDFIPQVIRPTSIGVNVIEMLMQLPRQQPRNDRKVLVMRLRQLTAIRFSLGERDRILYR